MVTSGEITRALDECAANEHTTVDGSAREIILEALAPLESEQVMEAVVFLVGKGKELAEADDRFWVTKKDVRAAVVTWQEREAERQAKEAAAETEGANAEASPDAADS